MVIQIMTVKRIVLNHGFFDRCTEVDGTMKVVIKPTGLFVQLRQDSLTNVQKIGLIWKTLIAATRSCQRLLIGMRPTLSASLLQNKKILEPYFLKYT